MVAGHSRKSSQLIIEQICRAAFFNSKSITVSLVIMLGNINEVLGELLLSSPGPVVYFNAENASTHIFSFS